MNAALVRAIAAWSALIASETLAQLCMKVGGESLPDAPFTARWLVCLLTSRWILIGVAGYVGSFSAWMLILDKLPLNLGFPLTSVVVVAVAIVSTEFLGESLTPLRCLSVGVIVAGVVLLGSGET